MKVFHEGSTPYLVPTEHPWTVLQKLPVQGRKGLCVAGSGDIPVYFSSFEPDSLTVVDVSIQACALTELKKAAYRRLNRQEFCEFFFHGIPEANKLWTTLWGLDPPTSTQRFALYGKLREEISFEAQQFLDTLILRDSDLKNPFTAFLRPTDRFHLGLLPCLKSDAFYRLWVQGAHRPFSIIASSLEDFLISTNEAFHIIYTSNIVEYLRAFHVMHFGLGSFRKFMVSFWQALHRVLIPKGFAAFYVCQGIETQNFRRLVKELAPPTFMEYKTQFVPIALRPPLLAGAVWRHVVVLFQKHP
ncbi:MAG: hypothetical protein WHS46_02295 [Desulfosoma sp.]